MLLIVTILLVVVGTISLVIGYVQSSLPPIYVSIGCSVLAAAVLLIFSRMTAKSQPVVTDDGGPSPLDFQRSVPAERTEPVPAMAGAGVLGRSSSGDDFALDPGSESRYSGEIVGGELADVSEDDFPIERYDPRRVAEILPLLAELDVDELDAVREHEERGKGRATVLARIDQLIDQLEAEDRQEAEHRFDAESPDVTDETDEVPATMPSSTQAVSVAALPDDDDDDDYFPIEDYDDLRASEILPLLPELDDDELEMVRQRERSGSARSSILHRLDALLPASTSLPAPGPVPADVSSFEPEPEPVVVPVVTAEVLPATPAKKARATKTPRTSKAGVAKATAGRVVAEKSPTSKAAAKATKAASKARTVKAEPAPAKVTKAAAVSKAPVKKTAAKKGVAVKAAKAPAEKPVRRAAPRSPGAASTPAAKTTRKASKR